MKIFTIKFEKILLGIFILIVLACIYSTINREIVKYVFLPSSKKIIVLDAGHGGWDPGRPGVHGKNEDDINLEIMLILQNYLEQSGSYVVITRKEDVALGKSKRSDMVERRDIVNESEGDLFISIHQNSYPSKNIKGAQVFYHKKSEEGKKLAKKIQEQLNTFADKKNNRVAKSDSSYFILRETQLPSVIVECGFISNPGEEKKLNSEEYQEKLAWSIYMGILNYFEDMEKNAGIQ